MAEYFEKEKLCDWCLKTGPSYCDKCVMNRHDLPASDVRPVVPGKWELSDETPYIRKHYHPVACSNCHRAGMKGWNYCPNCGADMREGS